MKNKSKGEDAIASAFQEVEDLKDKSRIRKALFQRLPILMEYLEEDEVEDVINSAFNMVKEIDSHDKKK